MVYGLIYPLIGHNTGTQSRLAGCISRATMDMDVDMDKDAEGDAAENQGLSTQLPRGMTVTSPPLFATHVNWV